MRKAEVVRGGHDGCAMCRLPKEILATVFCVLASSEAIVSSAKITGAPWGAQGVRNRFRICFAAILGQDADCVDSRMAADTEDHAHRDSTDAADDALAHVEHADQNVAACLP